MKKFAIVMAVLATLVGNAGYAQGPNSGTKKMGNAAQSGQTYSSNNFAWGIGLCALVVIGVVVGVTVAAAVHDNPSFVH